MRHVKPVSIDIEKVCRRAEGPNGKAQLVAELPVEDLMNSLQQALAKDDEDSEEAEE